MTATIAPAQPGIDRAALYFRFLIERGGLQRYGTPFWQTPERAARLDYELGVIEAAGFSATFVMLAGVMDFCRAENIPVGPGRGSVGGSYACYLAGIHDVDSIEWDLDFERFMNPERVSFPDVDIDVSQRHRARVLRYIVEQYTRDDQVVMQIGAFVRAGGRAVVDLMATALQHQDPNAWATATNLKKCFPEGGSITGGQKIQRELHAWLYEGKGHGDREQFIAIAEQAGWLDNMLKLDGMFTHLGKHAAGVVILRTEDLPFLPTVDVRDAKNDTYNTVTAYDMYSLDDLGYLKWDWLGLRTLDVIQDAHIFCGGTGQRDDLIALWREVKDDPVVYERLTEGRNLDGLFQMNTDGYKRTLRALKPTCFEHIVQLVALYRPGAIDFKRDDGKNMVEVFIDRMHGREPVTYDDACLRPILESTHGVILYQEQAMRIARVFAGFTGPQADSLRKAIGKKRPEDMAKLIPLWEEGCARLGRPQAVADRVWQNIEAASRYSWNKSHAVEYAIITLLSAWFPVAHPVPLLPEAKPAGFYAAEINSWEDKKERQANVIANARSFVDFRPPDVNVAEDRFIVDEDAIVFGLNGIKGMGEANRNEILVERLMGGPFTSYEDFCQRLPSVGTNQKLALIKCGAFDSLGEDRLRLLTDIPKGNRAWMTTFTCGHDSRKQSLMGPGEPVRCSKCKQQAYVLTAEEIERKRWTIAELLNENAKRRIPDPETGKVTKPIELPGFDEWVIPSDTSLAAGELEAMGYYISNVPLKDIAHAMRWHSANVVGGEIEKVTIKIDKNGDEYGLITLVQGDLTKCTVMVFASNWPQLAHRCIKGAQLLFRGREDGGRFLGDACWEPYDVRHHRRIKIWRDTEKPRTEPFDGEIATVRALEDAGYHVRLL